jgi:imidazole glycerol-phosphate synthase subunit HisH
MSGNMKAVSIIDYGMSNLLSICRAFEHVGATVKILSRPEEISGSDYLVLPGVGAFPDGMNELNQRGLTGPIRQFAETGKPLLGICLGMQMLLSKGMEHRETEGLNIIPGAVLPLPKDMPAFKVPNINWHSIHEPESGCWSLSVLRDTVPGTCFYFVHSYYAKPDNNIHVLASSSFGNLTYAAAVKKDNVTGTQFHPEKSGEAGLLLLKNFVNL